MLAGGGTNFVAACTHLNGPPTPAVHLESGILAYDPRIVLSGSQSGPPFVTVAPGIHCLNTRLLHFGSADCEGAVIMGRQAAAAIAGA